MKTRICTYLFLFICTTSLGQMKSFDYQREIIGVEDQWHSIELPNEIFAKLSADLSDIRIIGISHSKDTIEAPYLLKASKESIIDKNIDFQLLNQSRNKTGYFFSFKIPSKDEINQIQLDFKQDNFDWMVSLEGSQNQKDWYTLLEKERILSIKNEHTDYQHTQLNFPRSKFLYYRVQIASTDKVDLLSAKLSRKEVVNGKLRKYKIRKLDIEQDKKRKTTKINIDLDSPVLIHELKLKIEESYDYYRPIRIRYLTDSTKTEKKWIRNYQTILSGTLTSLEQNSFKFKTIKAQHLQVILMNQDNEALTVSGVEVSGYIWQLLARFKKNTSYVLAYGNTAAQKPDYDLSRFANKIPPKRVSLTLGEEQIIQKNTETAKKALFTSKKYLWAIMGLVILLLAWFTLKMMKKTEQE